MILSHWLSEICAGINPVVLPVGKVANTVFVSFLLAVPSDRMGIRHVRKRRVVINRILVGGFEGKGLIGRLSRRREDVRTDLNEVGWNGMDGIHLAHDKDKWRAFK